MSDHSESECEKMQEAQRQLSVDLLEMNPDVKFDNLFMECHYIPTTNQICMTESQFYKAKAMIARKRMLANRPEISQANVNTKEEEREIILQSDIPVTISDNMINVIYEQPTINNTAASPSKTESTPNPEPESVESPRVQARRQANQRRYPSNRILGGARARMESRRANFKAEQQLQKLRLSREVIGIERDLNLVKFEKEMHVLQLHKIRLEIENLERQY